MFSFTIFSQAILIELIHKSHSRQKHGYTLWAELQF